MRHILESEQWLPFPVPLVFAFLANPNNLTRLMPAWQQARIEELQLKAPGPAPAGSPAKLGAGTDSTMILSFRAIPKLPMRLYWHARITAFEWNDHFCDEQTAGPFAAWKHCHRVKEEVREGVVGTRITDHVEYLLPFGPLGILAHETVGRWQIRRVFADRHRSMERLMPQFAEFLKNRQR
ncbi:MAG TPA: SRPBCC family protein [Terriglobus sp.]